mgnify:CR=1 FL=1|jgi:pimeloyl-ACP methyl ester carboxylesterase
MSNIRWIYLFLAMDICIFMRPAISQDYVLQGSQPLALDPELQHIYWVTQRPAGDGGPSQSWDKVGLHRLLLQGRDPHKSTVIFFLPGMSSSAEQIFVDGLFQRVAAELNNHPELPAERINAWRNELKGIFTRSTPHVLAHAGYVIYGMDYRTHFVSPSISPGDLSFMSSWGWAMFLDDIATAIQKAKEDSGAQKVILAAESLGGLFALNYASCHAQQDISAMVLIDGGDGGRLRLSLPAFQALLNKERTRRQEPIALSNGDSTGYNPLVMRNQMLPQLLQEVTNIVIRPMLWQRKTYSAVMDDAFAAMLPSIWADPLARPVDPSDGKPYPEATYVDWAAQRDTSLFSTAPGQNTTLGLANDWATSDPYFPLEVLLESMDQLEIGRVQPQTRAKSAGVCPDGSLFVNDYSHIEVPTIGFLSRFGLTVWGQWTPQLGTPDVSLGGAYPDMGHVDMFIGTNSYPRISGPLLAWLASHGFMPQRSP